MPEYVHLHNHTQYSLLDGATNISAMMKKAAADGQKAVAMTDHGNMFGAFKFVREAKANGVKPIVGCEFYLVKDRHIQSFSKAKGEKDKRYHQLLLAKNSTGYTNLSKLCSLGFTEGFYNKFPRIDKEILVKYHEGIIATSCCIGAEIPQSIARDEIEKAEEQLKWWLDLFGDDYYIELQRHRGMEKIDLGRDASKTMIYSKYSQEDVNQILLGFAEKHNVKVIATNDSHYLEEEDADPHDILLCVNTGSFLQDEKRFKFPSSDFYFKSQAEMNTIFADVPQAIDTTMELASKVEELELARDVVLPLFPLPPGFADQETYLRHITYQGAKRRYGDITPPIQGRIDFELEVINNSGYPGYFLIVQDFTTTARQMGVSVGPGRGSAAGSVVAYCLGITAIDPIKYDLLFERFLNPERVSLPDIDIDFDDEGRSKVIDYVIEKYGKKQVAQIITYGTMAARMSLRDVGRVMSVPLGEVDKVAKTFPTQLGATLNAVLAEDDILPKLKAKLNPEDLEKAQNFRKLAEGDSEIAKMIQSAKKLEGSVRNTGIHACGVIITPDDITNYIPISAAKDSDLQVSQFDNSVVEDAGLLKMDFLGLKTLTIIKDAVSIIKDSYDVDIDMDNVDLEDTATYELFQRGETVGIFQYESSGMQKHLKDLKPNKFEDLIAMNALYRPGPMQYIPKFVERKHGREEIEYDLPEMEEYLNDTYGITVYQEQVMLLSQKLAGFSKGQADMLRKAMGKKKKKLIDEMYPKFLEGCKANELDEEKVKKIWKDWEAFASYAFNKSHSTCYAFIAFQTGYLKAHYPAAYMASVLNHNKNDISKVMFFLRECKRMHLDVLGPDINLSGLKFTVKGDDQIRVGLSALKGVGEGPVGAIIEERLAEGPFADIFDMTKRLNLRSVNKKCLESLAKAGALDSFENVNRATYFAASESYGSLIEHALKFGNLYQRQLDSNQSSLFGSDLSKTIPTPTIKQADEWDNLIRLEFEKEVIGVYLSGHPLDDFELEITNYTNCNMEQLAQTKDRMVKLAGMVTEVRKGVSQRGSAYGRYVLQDYNGSMDINLYNEDQAKWGNLFNPGAILYVEGMNVKSWSGNDYRFKPKDIKMLDSIGEKLTKSITINIVLDSLNQELVNALEEICEDYPGSHDLKVIFTGAGQRLETKSAAKKVLVNYEMVRKLEELGVRYKLN